MAGLIEKILGRAGYQKKARRAGGRRKSVASMSGLRQAQAPKASRVSRPAADEFSKVMAALAEASETAPKAGRSSVEEHIGTAGAITGFMQEFAGLNPVLPFELVDFISRAAIVNPDMNHATTNLVALANNGHNLVIEARNDAIVARAQERLNDRARNLYTRSAGVDGLIDHYITQIAHTGAVSSEDVISARMDGVEKVVIVPTERIRFKYIDGDYRPFQFLSTGEMIELNEATYSYLAFRNFSNSPYAIPLYVAAIESIMSQRDMQKNIKFVIRKLGLLGLMAMSLTPPGKKAGESDSEHESRKTKYLNSVLAAMKENYMQSLIVKFNDQTLEHHNITGEARGALEVWNLNEEQICSGMGLDPSIIGRNFSSTESFANVTYMFMIRNANKIRMLPKRRMERTYNLDLRLQGIPATVGFKFNDNPARDPLTESQAEATRNASIIKQAQLGVISPDEAAQKIGYENWFDPALMQGPQQNIFDVAMASTGSATARRVFRFDQSLQEYRFVRPSAGRLSLDAGRAGKKNLVSEKTVAALLQKFGKKYASKVRPFLKNSTKESVDVLEGFIRRSNFSDFADADDFAQKAFGVITSIYVDAFNSEDARDALKSAVEEIYQFYRTEDTASAGSTGSPSGSGAVTFTMDAIDTRTMSFMRRVDRFYLGKYIYNPTTESQVLDFLKERYLEGGEGLFGRGSREALDTFKALAVDKFDGLSDFEATRIINTSVQRMRTWGNIGQLAEAGFDYAEIYNPDPEAEICIYMNGRVIPVGAARDAVNELSRLTPEEFEARLRPLTPEIMQAQGIEAATANGEGFPPYHPNCKTRLIATEQTRLRQAQAPGKVKSFTKKEIENYLLHLELPARGDMGHPETPELLGSG